MTAIKTQSLYVCVLFRLHDNLTSSTINGFLWSNNKVFFQQSKMLLLWKITILHIFDRFGVHTTKKKPFKETLSCPYSNPLICLIQSNFFLIKETVFWVKNWTSRKQFLWLKKNYFDTRSKKTFLLLKKVLLIQIMFFDVNRSISLYQRTFLWINNTFFNSKKLFLHRTAMNKFVWFK